jgi:thiamine transport system ATP-binding protein
MEAAMTITVDGLTVRLGGLTILESVSMEAPDGETTAVLGPSGAGKSTLLRAIAGLERPSAGTIRVDGADVTTTPPHKRAVGLLFQDRALFPHMDVAANVAFGLKMERVDPARRGERVREVLELVGLAGFDGRRIGTLSGGEQQRVALARAIAPSPDALLLDEPLGSLDRELRDRLLDELAGLFSELGLTVIVVTHDPAEAFDLATHVVLLDHGREIQAGPPQELWRRPASEVAARLLGHTNVIEHPGRGRVLLRTDGLRIANGAVDPPALAIDAVVERSAFRGDRVILHVRTMDGWSLEVPASSDLPAGAQVRVEVEPAAVVRMDEG